MKHTKEFTVIVMDSDGKIKEYSLSSMTRKRVAFGRDESNQIIIHSPIVSRVHGYFEYYENKLLVYDNASTNGLIVNNQRLTTDSLGNSDVHEVREGDIIRIDDKNAANSMGIIMYCTASRNSGGWKQRDLLPGKSVTIGRSGDNNIRLDSVSVSRHHAKISMIGATAQIEDLNSANGVFVNGERVHDKLNLGERDVIRIGNSLIIVNSGRIFYKSSMGGTRISMQNVSRTVKVKGNNLKILDDVNITIEPNEFVAVIGGSGAGKSTVMNAMSGFEKADTGIVTVNDTNLYDNYHILKNIIGYVPQHDIIYENISLYKMLEYSAKIRMNEDVSPNERDARIRETLSMVELTEHKDKQIRSLSGGQKKRASIAVELLADPGLFFLDEPTSGLDPGTEASLMTTLNKLSKQNGKTIVMVTHTTQNLHLCDKVLFMGKGGKVCFYGTPDECLQFFEVENLTEIYNKVLTTKEVEFWNKKWKQWYTDAPKISRKSGNGFKKTKKPSLIRQFAILSSRYMVLIKNDTQRLLMIMLQPLLVTVLLSLVAADDVFEIYDSTKPILFAASCAGIWVGLFNSIQEICKERSILKREYMTNLRLGAYVMSKFAVQFIIAVIQSLVISTMFAALVGMPDSGVMLGSAFFEFFVTMLLTIMSSAAIGLIVSSLSTNGDKAMTIAPFLLIIQLLFSGILFELEGITQKFAYFTVSNWSVQALGITADLNAMDRRIAAMKKFEEVYEYTAGHLSECWLAMIVFVVICFIGSIIILRGVSNDSR